jgi:hypothetical protein
MAAIDLSIDQLQLDSLNPRITGVDTQRGVLQEILDDQGEKLYTLAEDMVNQGLSPIERLLVQREKKDSDRFITLEGNRRVAALKILVNPHVLTSLQLKESLQKRFEKLAKGFDRKNIEPIACFEVANRDEGNQWIYLRHTGENEGRGVVGWSGIATSRFRGNDPALQALKFVREYGNLNDDQTRLIDDRKFPITTLDRLLSTREVRDLIGVEIMERKLRSGLSADEVMKPLRRIVLDLAEKEINVSRLKNKAEQVEYIKKFDTKDKPDLSKIDAVRSIEEIHGKEFKSKPGKQTASKRRISDPSERKTLVPRQVKLNILDNKVAAIFKELKKLNIEDAPNALSVLLRVFLELSVDCYMDSHSMPLRFKNKQNKFIDKTLKQKVKEVVEYLVKVENRDRRDFTGITRGLSVEHSPLYIDLLHAYLHNRFVTPKTPDLMGAWDDAQRFFERIWP